MVLKLYRNRRFQYSPTPCCQLDWAVMGKNNGISGARRQSAEAKEQFREADKAGRQALREHDYDAVAEAVTSEMDAVTKHRAAVKEHQAAIERLENARQAALKESR